MSTSNEPRPGEISLAALAIYAAAAIGAIVAVAALLIMANEGATPAQSYQDVCEDMVEAGGFPENRDCTRRSGVHPHEIDSYNDCMADRPATDRAHDACSAGIDYTPPTLPPHRAP